MNTIWWAIKRMMLYLLLGFAMAWLVVWTLAFFPHRVDPGRYSFSQFSSARPGVRDRETYFIYDSRYIGIWELQFSPIRAARGSSKRGAPSAPTQLWWAWEPGQQHNPSDYSQLTTKLYVRLKGEYSGLEVAPEEAQEQPQNPSQTLEQPIQKQPISRALARSTPLSPLTNKMFYSIAKYGWPALSHRVEGAYNAAQRDIEGSMPSEIEGAFAMPVIENAQLVRFTIFPYQPIALGLVINTLFYAILAAVLLSIKRAYRHARRLRKGRCPVCSYELLFDLREGCSECGWRKGRATKSS